MHGQQNVKKKKKAQVIILINDPSSALFVVDISYLEIMRFVL